MRITSKPGHLFLLLGLLTSGLGCGLMDRVQKAVTESKPANNTTAPPVANAANSNKTFTDKAVDTAVGEKKIGIAECDEAMDLLEAQANDPDDNFAVKAVKKTMLNTFRDQLKKNLEENKANKKEVAKFCTEFRENLKDSTEEENANKSP